MTTNNCAACAQLAEIDTICGNTESGGVCRKCERTLVNSLRSELSTLRESEAKAWRLVIMLTDPCSSTDDYLYAKAALAARKAGG